MKKFLLSGVNSQQRTNGGKYIEVDLKFKFAKKREKSESEKCIKCWSDFFTVK
jgi:hypothetical protein